MDEVQQPSQGLSTATPQPKQGENTEPTFTQADVNDIATRTRREARESERKKLLEDLGAENFDTLKSLLADAKQRKEAEMSETDKLKKQLEDYQKQLDSEKQQRAALEQARVNDRRDNGLLELLDKAHNKVQVLNLIKTDKPDGVVELIKEDGTFDEVKAKKLIADYTAENAYLFKSGAPGSQSNSDGRPPQPERKALEQAQAELNKKFGKL